MKKAHQDIIVKRKSTIRSKSTFSYFRKLIFILYLDNEIEGVFISSLISNQMAKIFELSSLVFLLGPYANQRSMFWLWNQWQKEHADNLTTSSQTDYLETSYSSGYSSNYETLSQSVKPNSCYCVYPPRATPSPLTTPPFPHQTVPRESAIQQTATISNYVQVTKTPTLAVPATRTLSLLLVTHSLKKYTTATTLYSKPEVGYTK